MSDSPRPISAVNSIAQDIQIIRLSGDDQSTCIPITSDNVEIVASQDSSINSKARGSNMVKIQPVAKYDWEHKYHYGRLIAVSNSFTAYAIRGANNQAMIRVLSVDTAERSLLKGFTGAVTDLAFAHLDSPLLGCVDEAGNLMVWELTCTSSTILDQIVVHIRRPSDTPLNLHRRLIWCPFIPDDNEDNPDDTSQTLALLHEDRAEVWDLEVLRANNARWPVDATDLKEGLITVKGYTQHVSEGALSPDGTVLATASHDGYIKFWQIYIEGGQDKPRCLHELRPHGGRPLSCLLFCDNHKRQDPEVPFWRFLITGADQNQELKMWCTVSWTCLQTIRFSPDPMNLTVLPSLKASLDLSAEYLILTDVQRKVLYVMELRQDLEKGKATFTAVSEFLLTHPVLSFGVQDVAQSPLRHTEVLPAEEESESATTEGAQGPTESKSGIQIKLYCVHTKSLQDVQIWFQPNAGSNSTGLPHSDPPDSFGFSDHLTDQSSDKDSGSDPQIDLRNMSSLPGPADFLSNTTNGNGRMPKLMTPDAFMTPSTSVPASPGSSASSLTIVTAISSNSTDSTNSSRDESNDRLLGSPYACRTYHISQNDSQDPGAEQSDPEDEVAGSTSSSANCGTRPTHRLPVKDWKTSPRCSPKLKRKTKKDGSESPQSRQLDSGQMNTDVQQELLMFLRGQQRELTELRGQIEAMQSSIMAQVERALTIHQEQEHCRLEQVLAETRNQQHHQEELSQQLSHTLCNSLTNRMDKVIREEMKKTVPPSISKCLEPVTSQLSNTISSKMTSVEVTLKDNVSKVVKSKNTTDAIGRAAAEAMQGPIQAAYKDAFQSIVLPVFERGCQSMFQQINDSFKQGTQEYIQQLEAHAKSRKQREQETRDPMIDQLQQMMDGFQSSTDQLANSMTSNIRAEIQHQIQMMVGNLQESILSHVQRIVKGEVSLAMKEQQAVVTSSIMQAMRSAAGTPVPTAHLDYQTQQANILQLLQQGQLNQAFQQALSATDLNLVLYVCETIDSQQVFGQQPCPLSQPVLLSLIQQLSSNLNTRSELKISYLEDALMNLDHSDPRTRDHMASVLTQVRPKLFAFMQQDPHSPLTKRARRLMMMLQGLVNH
ncbi:enhancer of mRNA-decapping protein 4 isoform X3 [Phyllopteryx taeniolatus]|uniref:enhancer of mRNA-decapping protein 4 isoform X3 n=1 Tax=Phyllopteryx taeniolatus TaxID=161469 RepID=UPI002AD4865E|nr:enhancer of mRNA-decapping protein 4 isoform X3 [Phyllopteryx taeniolatus]